MSILKGKQSNSTGELEYNMGYNRTGLSVRKGQGQQLRTKILNEDCILVYFFTWSAIYINKMGKTA